MPFDCTSDPEPGGGFLPDPPRREKFEGVSGTLGLALLLSIGSALLAVAFWLAAGYVALLAEAGRFG